MFTREQFMELTVEEKIKVMDFKAKFHKKKAKAMADMERIPKNGYNEMHKYAYARESDVKDKIRPILNENGLSFSMELIENKEGEKFQTRGGGWMVRTDVKMLFTIIDTETGYFEEFTQDGTAMDTGDKGIYKAYSNTIKYALMNYFLIPTGDDVEKDSPTIEQPQDKPEKQQQPQQQRQQQNKPQTDGKPTWKKIMDAEDKLAELVGNDKAEVRNELTKKFGKLGKYKEMKEETAAIVLAQLDKWIEGYSHPQA